MTQSSHDLMCTLRPAQQPTFKLNLWQQRRLLACTSHLLKTDLRPAMSIMFCMVERGVVGNRMWHSEIWKYCQSISKVQAQVQQNLIVCGSWVGLAWHGSASQSEIVSGRQSFRIVSLNEPELLTERRHLCLSTWLGSEMLCSSIQQL